MPHDKSASGPVSEGISRSEARPQRKKNERDFLTAQAGDAKAAIARVIDEVKRDLAQGTDPRGWVRSAPWTTLGVATAAGFLAASVAIPSKRRQALRRLRRIEESLKSNESRNGEGGASSPAGQNRSLLHTFLEQVIRASQPVVTSMLTAALSPDPAEEDPPVEPSPSSAEPGTTS